jgi:hypothetical protein
MPDWQLVDDATRITRTFKLANFGEAASFVDKVGRLAEEDGHHPDHTKKLLPAHPQRRQIYDRLASSVRHAWIRDIEL